MPFTSPKLVANLQKLLPLQAINLRFIAYCSLLKDSSTDQKRKQAYNLRLQKYQNCIAKAQKQIRKPFAL